MKSILFACVTLAIALVGGAGSVLWALDREFGFATVVNGAWVATPTLGTPAADPYSRARFSRDTELMLGAAEGVVFTARSDSRGDPLERRCEYALEGTFPAARFWTLHLRDVNGDVIAPEGMKAAALHSYALLRGPGERTSIQVAPVPSPGNWLRTTGTGRMQIVLSLYDISSAGSIGIADIDLPRIRRVVCDG